MKIAYVSSAYVPSRRASAVHVMRMCSMMAAAGHDVTLFCKASATRVEGEVQDPFEFYGVPQRFSIRSIRIPELRGGDAIYGARLALALARGRFDLVYTRYLYGAATAALLSRPFVYEMHGVSTRARAQAIEKRVFASRSLRRVVVISEALHRLLLEGGALGPDSPVLVAHDGADPIEPDQAVAPLGGQSPRVGYIGNLYRGRGIDIVAELAVRLPAATFHIVGGSERDLEQHRGRGPANLILHGFVPHGRVSAYYRACDILLMPYQRGLAIANSATDTSAWMSPLKMFEYMSSGRAIVSSDLPVLREVLEDRRNALLVDPTDVDAWERAVRQLIDAPQLRARLGETALADFLANYTWRERARRVLAGL